MSYASPMAASFSQQWKTTTSTTFRDVAWPFRTIPTVAVLAWIATRADDPTVATYVVIGVGLMTTSNESLFQMGWVLSSEIFQGTMQHTLIARTPLVLVSLGKALAVTAIAGMSGLISLAAAWWVARELVEVASPVLLLVSVLFAVLAIVSTGFIWAPLFVLVGTRPGFFNAILPFATVFGGFIAPVGLLSPEVEAIARALPTAWTSDAIFFSIRDGSDEATRIALSWAAAVALSALYLGVTVALFRIVERRLRVTATLDAG